MLFLRGKVWNELKCGGPPDARDSRRVRRCRRFFEEERLPRSGKSRLTDGLSEQFAVAVELGWDDAAAGATDLKSVGYSVRVRVQARPEIRLNDRSAAGGEFSGAGR